MKSKYYVVYYRDFANTYYLVSPQQTPSICCQKTQNVLLEKKPSECVGQNSKDKSMIVLSLDMPAQRYGL